MQEQFVTYEIALKLKELGYPQTKDRFGGFDKDSFLHIRNISKLDVSAPLWQQAQEYLRESHDIHITIDYNSAGWFYRLWTNDSKKLVVKEGAFPEYSFSKPMYKFYYGTLRQAIKKSLKLIDKSCKTN